MGTWLVSEKIQKKTKRKQRLSLGLGATKPIDHTRARMVSRLPEMMNPGTFWSILDSPDLYENLMFD